MANFLGLSVQITLLPSAFSQSGQDAHQYLTSYIVNGSVAIDAGTLGLFQSPEEQLRIRHVFITHTHIDHLASLPIFVDNVYQAKPECVVVHGSETVLECLRNDIFSKRLWADYLNLGPPNAPFLRLNLLRTGEPIEVERLRLTPIEVNHTVPTLGFLVEDNMSAIVISSDTGPTQEIWERACQLANLKAVFLEASFPNSLAALADTTKHLTPKTFALEMIKIARPTRVIAVHIKVRHHAQVVAELGALKMPNVEVVKPGRPYCF